MLARRKFIALASLSFAAAFDPRLARADPAAPFDPAAYNAALAAGKPMLVEISAPWCPTCRAQKAVLAELLADPKFADLVHLDVDFDSRKDVVRALLEALGAMLADGSIEVRVPRQFARTLRRQFASDDEAREVRRAVRAAVEAEVRAVAA